MRFIKLGSVSDLGKRIYNESSAIKLGIVGGTLLSILATILFKIRESSRFSYSVFVCLFLIVSGLVLFLCNRKHDIKYSVRMGVLSGTLSFALIEVAGLGLKSIRFRDVLPEARDGAVVGVVDAFSKFSNPYSASWLYDNVANPPCYLDSGFFHVLPAVLFKWILPVSSTNACIIMSIIYVLVSMLMMFKLCKYLTDNVAISIIGSTTLFWALRRYELICFRPDICCVALCLIIVYIVAKLLKEETTATIDYVWLGLTSVLLVYLKIHYSLIVLPTFIIMLVKNKKHALKYMLITIASFVVVTSLTALLFPTFFSTFVERILEMFLSNAGDSSLTLSIKKWKSLYQEYAILFVGVLGAVLYSIKKKSFSLLEAFLYLDAILATIALTFLGKWDGIWLSYHYVLLMPEIILIVMIFLNRLFDRSSIIFYVASLGIMCLTIGNHMYLFDNVDLSGYEKVQQYVDEYADQDILLSPVIANYMIDMDKYNWNYGDLEYVPAYVETGLLEKTIFKYTNDYRNRNIEYYNEHVANIEAGKYKLVIMDSFLNWMKGDEFISNSVLLDQYYDVIDEFDISNEVQDVHLKVMVPKN